MPVSRHGDRRFVALAGDAEAHATARIGVLRGVVEQVGDDLREPDGVSLHADGRRGQLDGHLVVALGQERAARLQRLQGHRAEIERFETQVDLAEVDARDVQQVVDQPRAAA